MNLFKIIVITFPFLVPKWTILFNSVGFHLYPGVQWFHYSLSNCLTDRPSSTVSVGVDPNLLLRKYRRPIRTLGVLFFQIKCINRLWILEKIIFQIFVSMYHIEVSLGDRQVEWRIRSATRPFSWHSHRASLWKYQYGTWSSPQQDLNPVFLLNSSHVNRKVNAVEVEPQFPSTVLSTEAEFEFVF